MSGDTSVPAHVNLTALGGGGGGKNAPGEVSWQAIFPSACPRVTIFFPSTKFQCTGYRLLALPLSQDMTLVRRAYKV